MQIAESQNIDWWSCNSLLKKILVPLLFLYPLFIRFVQCLRRSVETGDRFPHLLNASKYASSFCVLLFSIINNSLRNNFIWIFLCTLTTFFQFYWGKESFILCQLHIIIMIIIILK